MQGRTADAVQNRSRKSHLQYMTAAGQVRYITAQMQDRMDGSDAGEDRCSTE